LSQAKGIENKNEVEKEPIDYIQESVKPNQTSLPMYVVGRGLESRMAVLGKRKTPRPEHERNRRLIDAR
jgi:hypothetical protein